MEKLTEDETFTISATGTDVKSVTQNLLAAVSGTSAPTGASFGYKGIRRNCSYSARRINLCFCGLPGLIARGQGRQYKKLMTMEN